MIIGVTGKKFHGKNTVADFYVKNHNFKELSFAEPLKKVCKAMFDFSDEQLYGNLKETIDERWGITPRTTFQFVGTDLVRNKIYNILPDIGENFWVKRFEMELSQLLVNEQSRNIIISDVRFPNEAEIIKKLGGIIIKVVRPDIKNNDLHTSENLIDEISADYNIINDGSIDDLYCKLIELKI